MFFLLGNPVYGRWFLDGSDSDVRLVAVKFVQLLMLGAWVGGKGSGVGFLYLTPIFGCRFFFQPILRENLIFVSYFFLTRK